MDNNDLVVFSFLKNKINAEDTLIDVGANNGDYTNFFQSLLNDNGKIYAIELHPDTYKKLYDKYKNKITEIFNYAISNIDGEIDFYEGSDSLTNNIIGHDVSFKKNKKLGKIISFRLDSLFRELPKIDLIKIDVEGAELLVLDGCKEIFNKIKNILIECHLDKDWDKIRTILDDNNFKCENILTREKIIKESKRPYQCFCSKNLNYDE